MKRQLAVWRIASILLVMTGVTSCGRADEAGLDASSKPAVVPCFVPEPANVPTFWNQRVTVSWEAIPVSEAISGLNEDLDLPISFIEGRSQERVSAVSANNELVRDVLRKLLGSAPEYQCKIVGGHVIVISDADAYAAKVHSVRIRSEYRARASRDYVELLAKQKSTFSDMGTAGGFSYLGDSPLYDEKVTLARESTVLEHLSQLLGDDPKVFFWVRRSATGTRYLSLGSVP